MNRCETQKPLAEWLADLVINSALSDIPLQLQEKGISYIADTMGCMLLGAGTASAQVIRDYAQEERAAGPCTLYGTALKVDAGTAALANGVSAHAYDMDDAGFGGHASATILSSALAAAQETGASGSSLLEAFCIGMEVTARVYAVLMSKGEAHYIRGWHTTSTSGPVGAAAAAARLYGLSTQQTVHAIACAADLCFGNRRSFGTMQKHINCGYSAQAGILSAKLARKGLLSNPLMFEKPAGFFDCFCDGYDTEPAYQEGWLALKPRIQKLYASCGFSQRTLTAVLNVRDQLTKEPEEIDSVLIHLPQGENDPLTFTLPQNENESKFSAEYAAAAALIDGRINLKTYTDEMVQRPCVQELMKKVKRDVFPGGHYTGLLTVDICYKDGTTVTCSAKDFPGGFTSPLTAGQIREKFNDCAAYTLRKEYTDDICSALLQITQIRRIEELAEMITVSLRP